MATNLEGWGETLNGRALRQLRKYALTFYSLSILSYLLVYLYLPRIRIPYRYPPPCNGHGAQSWIRVEIDRIRIEIDRIRIVIDRIRVQVDRIRI